MPELKNKSELGTVYSKDSMVLRTANGQANGEDGLNYELSSGMSGAPLIKSEQTGKYWSISWQELVNLALAAGIDNEGDE